MRIDILRQASAGDAPYLESFLYEPAGEGETVATALSRLNERPDLRNAAGRPAAPIRWEASCLQKRCGACAMVINGRPALACAVRLSGCKGAVRLEPLRKFPVVADLVVDRHVLHDDLRAMRIWLGGEALPGQRAFETGYEASRCLQCGCCLDVCPNFDPGGTFFGMAAGVPAARLFASLPGPALEELRRLYRTHVFEGCGKSLACRNICPAGIDIDGLLARSNAAAVWRGLGRVKGGGEEDMARDDDPGATQERRETGDAT